MTGDIILQRRSGIVGWVVSLFTKNEWVHCGIDLGNGQIVHVDWRGKRFTKYQDWKNILVLRVNVSLPDLKLAKLCACAVNEPVKGYSFYNAVMSWYKKNPDDFKRSGRYNQCAEFVSKVYRKIGIDLVPGRSDDTTQPQDFLTSPVLTSFKGNYI